VRLYDRCGDVGTNRQGFLGMLVLLFQLLFL